MLNMLRAELEPLGVFDPPDNEFVESLSRAIPFDNVPKRVKYVLSISHLTNYAGQFRRNIRLWDSTPVPINAISFVILNSGAGKDSSNNAIKKCFSPGFEILEQQVEKEVTKKAISRAKSAGEDPAEEYEVYRDYMLPIPPVFMAITTGPGLIQHINDIGALPLTSSFLYSGEISDELAYNPNAVENIKILSEVYDLGIKEAVYTKGKEFRTNGITGQPVSALFVGSPGHILYDEATKKKFHVAFMSKLARRSWFCYSPERVEEPKFDTVSDLIAYEEAIKTQSMEARAAISEQVKAITHFGLDTAGVDLDVDDGVAELFVVYKRYNSELVETLANQESTYALIRSHLQWKALKLAGALAIMDQSDVVTVEHYIDAIRYSEILDQDMEVFEKDLNKAPHEQFVDYMKTMVTNENKAVISVHDIKKLGFSSSVTKNRLLELIKLSAGYDTDGIYSLINEDSAVQYEPIIRTEDVIISYKEMDMSSLNKAVANEDKEAIRKAKESLAANTAYGFDVAETTFNDLDLLLGGDYAYSPFKFKNGVRGKNNIEGATKWLVLDIDDSLITASEAHFMLSDINHHVALSSDPNNDYKFRVLIELDAPVALNAVAWKHFYLAIANDLALKVDPLPQSQIFFSYANRPVMSNTDAEPLKVRDYVMKAIEKANDKEFKNKTIGTTQKRLLLEDALETFAYAFNSEHGAGSRNMIRAMYHAKDLGASLDEALELLEDINNYWISHMPDDRLERLKQQVTDLYRYN